MKVLSAFSALTIVLLLAACGGGGGSSVSASGTTLSGVASKGPLDGAAVCVYALNAGVKGNQIGACTTTDANGRYSLDLGGYRGDVLIEASGGSYTDEATGLSVTLDTPLRTLESNVSGGQISSAVTALTEVATRLAEAKGGLGKINFDMAVASVEKEFGVDDIRHTLPGDALQSEAGVDVARRQYGLALAGVAQFHRDGNIDLNTAINRIRGCLDGSGTCAGDRIALAVSQQRFIAAHSSLYPVDEETGTGGVCVVRAAGNTASLCLMRLDPATQACDAASLSPLLNATLVDYFQGDLSFMLARRCASNIHLLWDVTSRSVASRNMQLYSDAAGLIIVDPLVNPVLSGNGLTPSAGSSQPTSSGGIHASAVTKQPAATANVDVYGVLNIAISDSSDILDPVHILTMNSQSSFRITRAGSPLAISAAGSEF